MSWILGPAGLFWPLAMWIAGLSAALVFGLSISWLLPSLCTREAQCLLVSQSFVWVFGALCTLFGASMSFLLGNQCLAQMRSFGWAGGITWVLSLGGCEKGFGPFGGFPAPWSNARARSVSLGIWAPLEFSGPWPCGLPASLLPWSLDFSSLGSCRQCAPGKHSVLFR